MDSKVEIPAHEWVELKTDLKYIKEKVVVHIDESEKQGGYRDRLVLLEINQRNVIKDLAKLKIGYIVSGILGGIMGGFLSQIAPEAFTLLVRCITK